MNIYHVTFIDSRHCEIWETDVQCSGFVGVIYEALYKAGEQDRPEVLEAVEVHVMLLQGETMQ